MRIRLSSPNSARARRSGLTILEMLVSSAMLALIIVGLTAMFVQTQKAFKTGIKQTDVGDAGLTIVRMISDDLAQVTDGTGLNTNIPIAGTSNLVNLMWSWNTNSPILDDKVYLRTNQLQSIYLLTRTNTMWTGVGYAVSNFSTNLGVGTLYRYISPVPGRYFDNHILYSPFLAAFTPNFSNEAYAASANIRLSRVADGVVHLKIRVYDADGNQVGTETNRSYGDFYNKELTNSYPLINRNVTPAAPVALPASIDLELGILEPDAWEHLRSLNDNPTAQQTYLRESCAGKIDIFHKRILIRNAALP